VCASHLSQKFVAGVGNQVAEITRWPWQIATIAMADSRAPFKRARNYPLTCPGPPPVGPLGPKRVADNPVHSRSSPRPRYKPRAPEQVWGSMSTGGYAPKGPASFVRTSTR